jgi:hypothetical protein
MAYTTKTKIEAMFREIGIDASSTVVSDNDITNWISEADAEIDSALFKFYEVPITGVESLKIVSKISTLKVAHLILAGPLRDAGAMVDDDERSKVSFEKMAKNLLDDLIPVYDAKNKVFKQPNKTLIDAAAKDYGPGKGSKFKISTTTYTPIFKKGQDTW